MKDSNLRTPYGVNTLAGCRFKPLSQSSVVVITGIEPVTHGFSIHCSNQLSYATIWYQHVKELEWDKYKQKNPNLFSSGLRYIVFLYVTLFPELILHNIAKPSLV